MNGGRINRLMEIEGSMDSTRENILQRLRKNLADVEGQAPGVTDLRTGGITEDRDAIIGRFTDALEKVGGRVIRCRKEELSAELAKIFPIIERVWLEPHPYLESVRSDRFSAEKDPTLCGGAVTTCDALIAETGTVILSRNEHRTRSSSLVIATHCVVASPDQIVSTLDEYLLQQKKSDPGWLHGTSALTLITGPSRTADIEKVLIQGMHGPRELVLILVDGSAFRLEEGILR